MDWISKIKEDKAVFYTLIGAVVLVVLALLIGGVRALFGSHSEPLKAAPVQAPAQGVVQTPAVPPSSQAQAPAPAAQAILIPTIVPANTKVKNAVRQSWYVLTPTGQYAEIGKEDMPGSLFVFSNQPPNNISKVNYVDTAAKVIATVLVKAEVEGEYTFQVMVDEVRASEADIEVSVSGVSIGKSKVNTWGPTPLVVLARLAPGWHEVSVVAEARGQLRGSVAVRRPGGNLQQMVPYVQEAHGA